MENHMYKYKDKIPQGLQVVVQTRKKLLKYQKSIVRALVVWSDISTLARLRQIWEKLRKEIFGQNALFRKAESDLDILQKERDPPNNSDLRDVLKEFEQLIIEARANMEDYQMRLQELESNKGQAFWDLKKDLNLEFKDWFDPWSEQVRKAVINDRPRPKWNYSHSGRKYIHHKSGYLDRYRIASYLFNSWLKPSRFNKSRKPTQGPKGLEKVYESIDIMRGELQGLIQVIWLSRQIELLPSVCKNVERENAKAREELEKLGFKLGFL